MDWPMGPRLKDSASKRTLFVFGEVSGYKECEFSADGNSVLVVARWDLRGPAEMYVVVWHRRRPEWWWGVFYLWEFWLTVLFAALLIWSILRDRKALRREAA